MNGWHAALQLDYQRKAERTDVVHVHNGPLRVLKSLYPEGPEICHTVLVHPPSGLVGGDRIDIRLTVKPKAHALVTTPGATRFYRTEKGLASQEVVAKIHQNARLEWLPLETIAYNNCQGLNKVCFDIDAGGELIAWDITALGLPTASLPFEQGQLQQHMEIKNIWLERGLLDAKDQRLMSGPLGLANHRCTSTLIFATGTDPQSPDKNSLETPPLIQLMWLASPALPIGGFSYSEGLEAAIDKGLVHDQDSACIWLLDQLHHSQARGDMAVLAQMVIAWRARDTQRLTELSEWVHATRETTELRLQSEQMGRSMLEWLRNQNTVEAESVDLCNALVPTYPLTFSLALSLTGAPIEQCLQTFAFGWAENMVQAALKSIPLGQNSGQRILLAMAQNISQAVSQALATTDETRQVFSPMLAILSAQHEIQYSRLFRS